MGSASVFLIILIIGVVAYFLTRSRSAAVVNGDVRKLHSRPSYFGSHAAIWAILPATIFLLVASAIGGVGLAFALQGGMRREAVDAARRLDESDGVIPAQIDWFVTGTSARRQLGQWAPSIDARQLSMELASDLGPVSGRIAHVLQ